MHTVAALEAGLKLASWRPELATLTSQFDQNPMEFNCLSGVINLATGALMPHTPRHLHTHIAPVALAPALAHSGAHRRHRRRAGAVGYSGDCAAPEPVQREQRRMKRQRGAALLIFMLIFFMASMS